MASRGLLTLADDTQAGGGTDPSGVGDPSLLSVLTHDLKKQLPNMDDVTKGVEGIKDRTHAPPTPQEQARMKKALFMFAMSKVVDLLTKQSTPVARINRKTWMNPNLVHQNMLGWARYAALESQKAEDFAAIAVKEAKIMQAQAKEILVQCEYLKDYPEQFCSGMRHQLGKPIVHDMKSQMEPLNKMMDDMADPKGVQNLKRMAQKITGGQWPSTKQFL